MSPFDTSTSKDTSEDTAWKRLSERGGCDFWKLFSLVRLLLWCCHPSAKSFYYILYYSVQHVRLPVFCGVVTVLILILTSLIPSLIQAQTHTPSSASVSTLGACANNVHLSHKAASFDGNILDAHYCAMRIYEGISHKWPSAFCARAKCHPMYHSLIKKHAKQLPGQYMSSHNVVFMWYVLRCIQQKFGS